ESSEGQAIELDWIAARRYDLEDEDYVRMAYKKTCWYTVIAPLRIGVICGTRPGPDAPVGDELLPLTEFGFNAGIAFQIHDDLLNLEADEVLYGKEISGDLWEGKRTIMLLHFLRTAGSAERDRAIEILDAPRARKRPDDVGWLLQAMVANGSLEYGRARAHEFSERAIKIYSRGLPLLTEGDDKRFLREMLRYVIERPK
ncbi:MAG TPA: polyprenyl synthetase family protein, partial [Acidimicrobiia bacterium]|nr:polyprenyl synthetase family protein [Acidimicrobiia bacterium]